MTRYMNSDDIRRLLASRIQTRRGGRPLKGSSLVTQEVVARELGVTQGYLSQFLSGGRQTPAEAVLVGLGFDPQPYYRKRD